MAHTLSNLLERARPANRWTVVACLAGLCVLLGLWAWQGALRTRKARLTHLSIPGLVQAPCPATGGLGPAVELVSEWVLQDDVVPVIRAFVEHGLEPTTYMTTTMELATRQPKRVRLGLAELRIYRGASLAYTEDRDTRVVSSVLILVCPP